MMMEEVRERFTLFIQNNKPTNVAYHHWSTISGDGDELKEEQLIINKIHDTVSSSSFAPLSLKSVPHSPYGL